MSQIQELENSFNSIENKSLIWDMLINNRIFDNTIDLHTSVQKDNCFPDLGIISGNMSSGYNHNVLSNNTADIESKLFGIGSTNLVKPQKIIIPQINNLNNCKWMNKLPVFIPAPLVQEKYQRPTGPFSS